MAKYEDTLVLNDKVSATLEKIDKNMGKVQKSSDKVKSRFDKLKVAGANCATALKGITTAAIGFSAAAFAAIKQAADFGDRIDDMSQQIGMSRQNFQEWDYILTQNGGSVESLKMGYKSLTAQIGAVQSGSKDAILIFKKLGVSVKDANGQLRSQDDIFNDTIRALQKIDNATQRNIIANKLFGRSSADLRAVLNLEAEAVDKLRAKANKLGLILTEEEVQNASDFNDEMDTFTRFFQAKFAGQLLKMMPDLISGMEDLISYTQENQEAIEALGQAVGFLGKGFVGLVKAIMWVANALQFMGKTAGENWGKLLSIPDQIAAAFYKILTPIQLFFVSIKKQIEDIRAMIHSLGLDSVGGIIGGVTKSIKNIQNQVRQNNSTVNNNNAVTNNNYYGNLVPVAAGANLVGAGRNRGR